MESAKIKAVGEYVILENLPQKSVLIGADSEGLKVVSSGAHVSITLLPGETVLVRPQSAEPISSGGKSYWYVAATDIICRIVPEDEGRPVPQNA